MSDTDPEIWIGIRQQGLGEAQDRPMKAKPPYQTKSS